MGARNYLAPSQLSTRIAICERIAKRSRTQRRAYFGSIGERAPSARCRFQVRSNLLQRGDPCPQACAACQFVHASRPCGHGCPRCINRSTSATRPTLAASPATSGGEPVERWDGGTVRRWLCLKSGTSWGILGQFLGKRLLFGQTLESRVTGRRLEGSMY